jgi:hypothetical membrane protein
VPFIYFAIPVVAAPFYPGYSFIRNTASDLGSDQALHPAPVNAAIITLGIVMLLAAYGIFRGMARVGINPIMALVSAVSVASAGLGTLLSGVYPSPDPRHGGGALGAGLFFLPFLIGLVLWRKLPSRALRGGFLALAVLFIAMVPIMSGVTPIDTATSEGLWQRILALTAFGPIGLGAYALLRLTRTESS